MALYAIGDVQGCREQLERLLAKIGFDAARDTLWFTGDLVNRGPDSAGVLRLVMALPRVVSVLGNHDLHLLAAAASGTYGGRRDTFDDVLDAPDRDALLDWLRARPLLHHDAALGCTLIHAGLPPQWTLATAMQLAREAGHAIRQTPGNAFFDHMYGDTPDQWDDRLAGNDRLRFTVNCFTRLRYVDRAGRLYLGDKGAPGTQAPGLVPWFDAPGRKSRDARIVFGHWSTLGARVRPDMVALDSGCLWGRQLTAARLDADPAPLISVSCAQAMRPSD